MSILITPRLSHEKELGMPLTRFSLIQSCFFFFPYLWHMYLWRWRGIPLFKSSFQPTIWVHSQSFLPARMLLWTWQTDWNQDSCIRNRACKRKSLSLNIARIFSPGFILSCCIGVLLCLWDPKIVTGSINKPIFCISNVLLIQREPLCFYMHRSFSVSERSVAPICLVAGLSISFLLLVLTWRVCRDRMRPDSKSHGVRTWIPSDYWFAITWIPCLTFDYWDREKTQENVIDADDISSLKILVPL